MYYFFLRGKINKKKLVIVSSMSLYKYKHTHWPHPHLHTYAHPFQEKNEHFEFNYRNSEYRQLFFRLFSKSKSLILIWNVCFPQKNQT